MNDEILEKYSIFKGLTRDAIQQCLGSTACRVEHYEKDAVIFHAMEKVEQIGIILSGKAEAQKIFPTGSQVDVSVRAAGDMIGPGAAFSKAGRYPCDVVALEKTAILFFRKAELLDLMNREPRILKNFLEQLATATYVLQQKLELFSYSGIAQKAAFSLLMHYRQTGSAAFPIPESVTKWALMLNVSRPSLHRELKKMEKAGLIRYAPPEIIILDPQKMEQTLS